MSYDALEAVTRLAAELTDSGVVALISRLAASIAGQPARRSAFALTALLAVTLRQEPPEVRAQAATAVMLAGDPAQLDGALQALSQALTVTGSTGK